MGLAVSVKGKRMTVAVVVLDDHSGLSGGYDEGAVTVEDSFEVKGDQADLAVQLSDAATVISGRARSLQPDVVVVRRADMPPRPSNLEGPRLRLLLEGAVTAAAHAVVPTTMIRSGKDCGAAAGLSKDDLDNRARSVCGGGFTEAAAAALSGLIGNRAGP